MSFASDDFFLKCLLLFFQQAFALFQMLIFKMLIVLLKSHVNFSVIDILWVHIQIQVHSDKIFLSLSFYSAYLLNSASVDLFNLVCIVLDNFL